MINFDDEKEEDDEEWMQEMSPRFLKSMIESTPRPIDALKADKHNFEDSNFVNSLFRVEFYQRTPAFSAVLELKLNPPMDQYG